MENQFQSVSTTSVNDVASYLNLIGYQCVKRIHNMMLVMQKTTVTTGVGIGVPVTNYGLVDLRDMSVFFNLEYLLPSETPISGGMFKYLADKGYVPLVKFESDPANGRVDRYLSIVDCINGTVVMNGRRRGYLKVYGNYIVTAKELRDRSRYRMSFVDMIGRNELDVRVDLPSLNQIFNAGSEFDKEYSDGLCRYYFKSEFGNVTGVTPRYEVPKHWGKRFIYLTSQGIRFDTDILTEDLDAIPIRFQLKTDDSIGNNEDGFGESLVINKTQYKKMTSTYFWVYSEFRDWVFLDSCGKTIGRYKYDRLGDVSDLRKDMCKYLCDAVDKMKDSKLFKETTSKKEFANRDVFVYDCDNKDIFSKFGVTLTEYVAC